MKPNSLEALGSKHGLKKASTPCPEASRDVMRHRTHHWASRWAKQARKTQGCLACSFPSQMPTVASAPWQEPSEFSFRKLAHQKISARRIFFFLKLPHLGKPRCTSRCLALWRGLHQIMLYYIAIHFGLLHSQSSRCTWKTSRILSQDLHQLFYHSIQWPHCCHYMN